MECHIPEFVGSRVDEGEVGAECQEVVRNISRGGEGWELGLVAGVPGEDSKVFVKVLAVFDEGLKFILDKGVDLLSFHLRDD